MVRAQRILFAEAGLGFGEEAQAVGVEAFAVALGVAGELLV